MPISGLSNQWKSFDGLLNRFATVPGQPPDNPYPKYQRITQLLVALNKATEYWIYVGTSHSQMNFVTRNSLTDADRTQPFAYVDVATDSSDSRKLVFRVRTRKMYGLRPTTQWETAIKSDVDDVVRIIMNAFQNAETPVLRING